MTHSLRAKNSALVERFNGKLTVSIKLIHNNLFATIRDRLSNIILFLRTSLIIIVLLYNKTKNSMLIRFLLKTIL